VKYLPTKTIVVEVEVEVPTTTTTITTRTPITITTTIIAGRVNSNTVVTVGTLATAAAFLKHQWCHRMLRSPRRLVHQQEAEEEEAEVIIAKADDHHPMKAGEVVEDEGVPMEVDAITTATAITTIRMVGVEVVAVVVDETTCL
jgi:hypothetical protein